VGLLAFKLIIRSLKKKCVVNFPVNTLCSKYCKQIPFFGKQSNKDGSYQNIAQLYALSCSSKAKQLGKILHLSKWRAQKEFFIPLLFLLKHKIDAKDGGIL